MIDEAFHYGLPARRRGAVVWKGAAGRGIPVNAIANSIRLLGRRSAPHVDDLLRSVAESWGELSARTSHLPPSPPMLSALALVRSAGLTVFVFGEEPPPLLVLKVPEAGDERVDREVSALEEAGPAQVAPAPLGRIGEARVQEALAGSPMRLEPITVETAASLRWSPRVAALTTALIRISGATAKAQFADEIRASVERSLAEDEVSSRTRRLLAAAWRDVMTLKSAVLRHHDTSPQNCLFSDDRLVGIVDWEMAVSYGAPAFDVWNAALSYMEHGLGLTVWSQQSVGDAFAASWDASEYWYAARAAARSAALEAGVPERHLDALELVFFGSRVGDRLRRPGWHPTRPSTAARMLDRVASGA